ncbi:MAG: AI-2E family transporter [Bacilli bacterium]
MNIMLGRKKEHSNELDIKGLNSVIEISRRVLKVIYIMALIAATYIFIRIGKELNIFNGILIILKIVSPLFIGMIIAWLFNPAVTWLQKKGIRRTLATFLVYFILITGIGLFLTALIPSLYVQINEFVGALPSIYSSLKEWFDNIFDSFNKFNSFDTVALEKQILEKITTFSTNFAESLPELILGILSSLLSGVGTILVSLVIGFFLLVGFENTDAVIGFLPRKIQEITQGLLNAVDTACRSFVTGSILDCLFIFVISSIGLYFVGLKAPLLFGLFCGITNIIPYLGPYIGGVPAVIVGFSQGVTTGILTLIVIGVIQLLEGNLLQPIILSKTTKLHPVTIMLGLLVFGYFFGITGMVISTPLIAAFKAIVLYLDKKYDILNFN